MPKQQFQHTLQIFVYLPSLGIKHFTTAGCLCIQTILSVLWSFALLADSYCVFHFYPILNIIRSEQLFVLTPFTYIAVWGYTEFTLWLLYYRQLLFTYLFSFCNKPLLSPFLPLCGSVCTAVGNVCILVVWYFPPFHPPEGIHGSHYELLPEDPVLLWRGLAPDCDTNPVAQKHSTHLDFPNIHVILNFFINPFLNHSYKV